MSLRLRRRLWRASTVGVALYAVFLITGQFEHHDVVCHIKTSLHCTSCASSVLGSHPDTLRIFDGSPLADAGRAFTAVPLAHGFLLPVRSTGRSPPQA